MNSSLNDKARAYQARPDLLKDRVVVITGAGDGIGRELAEKCAAHGATVVLVGRTTSKLEEVYDAIEAAGGPTPAIVPLDLAKADETELRAVGSALAEHFDCVHGLVHNAALLGDRQPMASTSYSTWVELMQVNVNAPLVLTQAILPLMDQADDASIIFTSSGVGRRGQIGRAHV